MGGSVLILESGLLSKSDESFRVALSSVLSASAKAWMWLANAYWVSQNTSKEIRTHDSSTYSASSSDETPVMRCACTNSSSASEGGIVQIGYQLAPRRWLYWVGRNEEEWVKDNTTFGCSELVEQGAESDDWPGRGPTRAVVGPPVRAGSAMAHR